MTLEDEMKKKKKKVRCSTAKAADVKVKKKVLSLLSLFLFSSLAVLINRHICTAVCVCVLAVLCSMLAGAPVVGHCWKRWPFVVACHSCSALLLFFFDFFFFFFFSGKLTGQFIFLASVFLCGKRW